MRLKRRQQSDRFSQVIQQIRALSDSEFGTVAKWLSAMMESANDLPESSVERQDIVSYVAKIVERLPSPASRRFMFDAYLIQLLTDTWGLSSLGSVVLIPTYNTDWGFEYYTLFPNRYLSFIHIPDNPENFLPELLDYTWLIHELGHYIIKFEGKLLLETYKTVFDKEVTQVKLRSGADRGTAKTIAQRKIESYYEYWSPQSKWSYEIMIDSIALWCCGYAYLATYYENHQLLDPFCISPKHPPVELRTKALIYAANKLGWKDSTDKLEKLWANWDRDRQSAPDKYRDYNATRHLELMESSVDCAISFCQKLSLPCLTPSHLDRLKKIIKKNIDIDDDINLIAIARLVYETYDDAIYEQWVAKQFDLIA